MKSSTMRGLRSCLGSSMVPEPSCCTTWGIRKDGYDLLQVLVRRLEYPDLKALVVKQAEAFGANVERFEESGMQVAKPRVVYTSRRRGGRSKW